ncbi:MAG: holo-ACP synthase [Fimbriimonadaceae bacterium]|nr:holo-ACP synthase [Fimbriimonadaceae bacterium]
MIERIGVDVVETARVAQAMKRPGFTERILTSRERGQKMSLARVAGRWAAKEAVAKCLPGVRRWHDVEVFNKEDGSPYLEVHHPSFDASTHVLHLSISHERGLAAAMVVLERKSGC